MLVITPFYAAILALFYIGLSFLVIKNRWRFKQSLGSGSEARLEKTIRMHGNFSEYVPLILIMMGFLELNKTSTNWLHFFGILIVCGRALHAYGLSAGASNPFRVVGMLATFSCLIGSAIKLITYSLEHGF